MSNQSDVHSHPPEQHHVYPQRRKSHTPLTTLETFFPHVRRQRRSSPGVVFCSTSIFSPGFSSSRSTRIWYRSFCTITIPHSAFEVQRIPSPNIRSRKVSCLGDLQTARTHSIGVFITIKDSKATLSQEIWSKKVALRSMRF